MNIMGILSILLCMLPAGPCELGMPALKEKGIDVDVYLAITPQPQQVTYGTRGFHVKSPQMQWNSDEVIQSIGKAFADGLTRSHALAASGSAGLDCVVTTRLASQAGGLELPEHPQPGNPEGYTLRVRRHEQQVEIVVAGHSAKGIEHGLQSLRQLFMTVDGRLVVREAVVVDWPVTPLRLVKRHIPAWLDLAVAYKLNGGTRQLGWRPGLDQPKVLAGIQQDAEQARRRRLHLLAMVNMGNLYRGQDEVVKDAVDFYTGLHRAGCSLLAIMNDDRMTLSDHEADQRFGGYFQTQAYYARRIDDALRQQGYVHRLGFMANRYHGQEPDEDALPVYKQQLPADIAWFWAGTGIPGPSVEITHLTHVRDQVGRGPLWFYANWPQVGGPYYAKNYGPARHRNFGLPELTELVTISTDLQPDALPVSFITMADLLWNPQAYDPDRALRLAVKELVDPASFDAFLDLFQSLDAMAPLGAYSQSHPMAGGETHEQRVKAIQDRSRILDAKVAACRATPAGSEAGIKRVLDQLAGKESHYLEQLRIVEDREAKLAPRQLAVPTIATPPRIDGVLDDPAWKQAALMDGFTDLRGQKPAPHQTAVRVLRSADTLYLGIVCQEPFLDDPSFMGIGQNYPLRISNHGESLWWADEVEIFLDPGRDGRNVCQILANPWGLSEGFSFDSVRYGHVGRENIRRKRFAIEGIVNRTEQGIVYEVAIPMAQLAGHEESVWGINVGRTRLLPVGDGMRYSTWTPLSWGFQDATHFGVMTFLASEGKALH